MQRLIGFAMCLVVGALVTFVAIASYALLTSVRDAPLDARRVLAGALGFAIACDAMRARRRPRVPRATLR